jgi:hypothetical protein
MKISVVFHDQDVLGHCALCRAFVVPRGAGTQRGGWLCEVTVILAKLRQSNISGRNAYQIRQVLKAAVMKELAGTGATSAR